MVEHYNKFIAKNLSLTRRMLRRDLKYFSDIIGDAKLMLDVGGGREFHFEDIIRPSSIISLDLYRPSQVQGDASALPFTSQCVDTVICTEVFEHLTDPDLALSEIHRVLTQLGFLIVTVPFLWGVHDIVDYHRWTETGLENMLIRAGFKVLSLRRRGGVFSAIGNMIAQIPRQVFGRLDQQRSWISKSLYLIFLLPSLVVPWIMSPFDILDRQKHFVMGYSVLCQKG